jgi:hypothetical protein
MDEREHADPDPADTPGLTPGGGVYPGDTPPAEGGTLDTGPEERHNPTRGWAAWPVLAIAACCVLVAGFFLARLILMLR